MLSICKNKSFIIFSAAILSCIGVAFAPAPNAFEWSQRFFVQRFNPIATNVKLKRWEFNITTAGFFRFRKYHINGKQEYFSFTLKKLIDIGYLGSTSSGNLVLKTKGADIIVQTYNDPKGNIDSMSHSLIIPVQNITAESLDSLQTTLLSIREVQN